MNDKEFEQLKKTYPDRIQEILNKHIIAGKKMIRVEVERMRRNGEILD